MWRKCTSFNVWVTFFVWNFKGYLWNSTQNIVPIHWKVRFLYNVENVRALIFKSSCAFLKRHPAWSYLVCRSQFWRMRRLQTGTIMWLALHVSHLRFCVAYMPIVMGTALLLAGGHVWYPWLALMYLQRGSWVHNVICNAIVDTAFCHCTTCREVCTRFFCVSVWFNNDDSYRCHSALQALMRLPQYQ